MQARQMTRHAHCAGVQNEVQLHRHQTGLGSLSLHWMGEHPWVWHSCHASWPTHGGARNLTCDSGEARLWIRLR